MESFFVIPEFSIFNFAIFKSALVHWKLKIENLSQYSLLPSIALLNVLSSAYSKSPPIGSPRAILVSFKSGN